MTADQPQSEEGQPSAKAQPPATAGMTLKVVKGSLWTFAGQVAPLAVSIIATPFTIRLLGPESYGVLILIGLIPTYLGFADLGMSVASTKFAAEAYGQGDTKREASVIQTALLIAAIPVVLSASLAVFNANSIITFFNVPEGMRGEATSALRLTLIFSAFGVFATILNSPMLSRLRMGLNTLTIAIPKVLLVGITPIVLYIFGGLLSAIWWSFLVTTLATIAIALIAIWILPELKRLAFDSYIARLLVRFGGSWALASVASILLVNFEKFILATYAEVKALAYYSVAFTVANMTTMFSQAMIQSLIPAFSQLQSEDKLNQFHTLLNRSIRLTLLWIFPVIFGLALTAKSFFTIWAGAEFGRESTAPFYILLIGIFVGVIGYVPFSALLAVGRSDIFAKLYWLELIIYSLIAIFLVQRYQATGAAIAFSLRATMDTTIVIAFAKRLVWPKLSLLSELFRMLPGVAILFTPLIFALFLSEQKIIIFTSSLLSLFAYTLFVWKRIIKPEERMWLLTRINSQLDRIKHVFGQN